MDITDDLDVYVEDSKTDRKKDRKTERKTDRKTGVV